MSLQGSLNAFALPDVLILLAGTAKSGELVVTSQTGGHEVEGRVWFDRGTVVGYDIPSRSGDDPAAALSELLAIQAGSFAFSAGSPVPPEGVVEVASLDVEPLLEQAQAHLAHRVEHGSVTLPASGRLSLADPGGPAGSDVCMSSAQWSAIVVIAGGSDFSAACDHLGRLGMEGATAMEAVVDLVARGLLVLAPDAVRPDAVPLDAVRPDAVLLDADLRGAATFPAEATAAEREEPTALGGSGESLTAQEMVAPSGGSFSSFLRAVPETDESLASAPPPTLVDRMAEPKDEVVFGENDLDRLVTLPARAQRSADRPGAHAAQLPGGEEPDEPRRTSGAVLFDKTKSAAEALDTIPADRSGGRLPEAMELARQLETLTDASPPEGNSPFSSPPDASVEWPQEERPTLEHTPPFVEYVARHDASAAPVGELVQVPWTPPRRVADGDEFGGRGRLVKLFSSARS